jgi:hypothetical protein
MLQSIWRTPHSKTNWSWLKPCWCNSRAYGASAQFALHYFQRHLRYTMFRYYLKSQAICAIYQSHEFGPNRRPVSLKRSVGRLCVQTSHQHYNVHNTWILLLIPSAYQILMAVWDRTVRWTTCVLVLQSMMKYLAAFEQCHAESNLKGSPTEFQTDALKLPRVVLNIQARQTSLYRIYPSPPYTTRSHLREVSQEYL